MTTPEAAMAVGGRLEGAFVIVAARDRGALRRRTATNDDE
jgi:hypothetical protein